MTAMHGTHPVWYLLGTVFIASVIAGVYVGVRDRIVSATAGPTASEPVDDTTGTEQLSSDQPAQHTKNEAKRRILDLLPDDEKRILEPVLDSPGLTQIELRDRSNFSKSKVSQTVTDLEKRGLLYREPQGRTYRIYPAEDVENEQ
ncbi:MarR family transcriptional regulator [Natronolimnobius sp. AArcel1]|uniref:helix-turn-helix transcriptional regulator n=1 Tax=Natronolimnobius sp. AArcel1 TaxID=1679093 RepID=UPI001F1554C6|nr:MarR family transcriptional regulator [Natronolimnobius sp. AArcel1]